MHDEPRVSRTSLFDEARGEFRDHGDIETVVMARIASLPENDFCHFARESFQDGVGFAYLRFDGTAGADAFIVDTSEVVRLHDDVVEAFFHTRPRNRHSGFDKPRVHRELLEQLAIQVLFGDHKACPDSVDQYEFAAFLAFIEGYQLVTNSLTHNQH